MSDNIPFDIQMQIIKKVSNVKSLIQFRSVSKPWKSFIDSSKFIKGYGARHTQPCSRILTYEADYSSEAKYICLVDDDIETFKVQQQEFVVSPLLEQYIITNFIGVRHGLLCFYGFHEGYNKRMVVIWNPSIGKSFGIALPSFFSKSQAYFRNKLVFGFGVCPVNRDPTVVKIKYRIGMPWHVEVFTLSSGVWNVISSGNLPRQSVKLNKSTQVVIDRFIYWGAREKTFTDDGESTTNHLVVSFDLITKEFKVVDLPDTLTNELGGPVSVSKLRGSLVVYGSINVVGAECCGVWVLEHDSSFKKLFAIGIPYYRILGFKKSGETMFETRNEDEMFTTLDVYDPCTQQIKNIGISGVRGSFFMGSYKESLLLLHSDLHIYCDDN
ncbi:probable galacturonosyltransferase 7 isoform X2 [Tanacetum coccineum]